MTLITSEGDEKFWVDQSEMVSASNKIHIKILLRPFARKIPWQERGKV